MDKLVMTIVPTTVETRLILHHGPDEVMKARLCAISQAHHRWAAPMLLEAIAIWHGQRIRAVVSAAGEDFLYGLGLFDGLGLAHSTLHYEVEHKEPGERRQGKRIRLGMDRGRWTRR